MQPTKQLTPTLLPVFLSVLLVTFLLVLSQSVSAGAPPEQRQETVVDPTSTATPTLTGEEMTTTPLSPSIIVSETVTPTITITPTITFTPTITVTTTFTATPTTTAEPSPTPTPTPNPDHFLPLIMKYPTPRPVVPPETFLFCDSLPASLGIPDNSAAGVEDTIFVSDPRLIYDLNVALYIDHTWVGDLAAKLTHLETGTSVTLLDRPGIPSSSQGCSSDDVATVLDDEISSAAEFKCASSPAAISGVYQPNQPLGAFDQQSMAGTWTLNISDHFQNDAGRLTSWCLVGEISESPPTPTPTVPPPPVPPSVRLTGVSGQPQALPLNCESRSAVDWAAYFGYYINELTFTYQLPHSDNPDRGFVGNVNGVWGQIPPHSYGVHVEPVAALLRQYGLPAYAHRPLSWEALKAEIAAGRPVQVWIVGSVYNGIPLYYTPSDGLDTIVARYEHTVVVTGYSEERVYYLNGGTIYSKPIWQFLDSWSALGNMAITSTP